MPHRPLDRKSARMPSKKQLGVAAKAWRADHPEKPVTARELGELDPYLKGGSTSTNPESQQEG